MQVNGIDFVVLKVLKTLDFTENSFDMDYFVYRR